MVLITSAAYVTSGLATEYGKIPPSFLPLQNKRLFEHQLNLFYSSEAKVISLPIDFKVSEKDYIILESYNVKVVFVPEGLSLGQSIVYVLNSISKYTEPLRILHGDTFFKNILNELDTYLIAKISDNYDWDLSDDLKNDEIAYAGFFSFSNQSLLIKSITESKYNFIDGILGYKQKINVEEKLSEGWLDFGHTNTYYFSKTHLTTQRSFNGLEIDGFSVIKSSYDKSKILAEANWFNSMPQRIKRYIPALWDSGIINDKGFYQIEYFYLSSLSELFVFGKNEYFIWNNILTACNDFLIDCLKFEAPISNAIIEQSKRLYTEKTLSRLQDYTIQSNIDLDKEWIFNDLITPSLNQIIREMDFFISDKSINQSTIIHGDFGFSNILYNFRTKSIKVIDPRGIDFDGNQTIYGDIRYDIAKLAHSVIGLYDFIIAGYFSYEEKDEYNINFKILTSSTIEKIQSYFINTSFGGLNITEANTYPILVNLFLSMLPLHNDNPIRQKAMLANALRIYWEFKNFNK